MKNIHEAGPEDTKVAARMAQAAFRKLLDEVGATDSYLAARLRQLAEFSGEKPMKIDDEIQYTKPLDQPRVQLDAIKEIIKLKGLENNEKVQVKEIGPRLAKAIQMSKQAALEEPKETIPDAIIVDKGINTPVDKTETNEFDDIPF